MKVLNLRCSHEHRFEGWFNSETDFQAQDERGEIACPLCADKAISRLPSAPHLNVSHLRGDAAEAPPALADIAQARAQMQMLVAARELLKRTEDVGERFPEEARRIHYGEVERRGIRGRASAEDADALRDEGIEVMSMVLPEALKGPVQ